MSFTVSLNVERKFETTASSAKVFGLLSDVPKSTSCFPDVESLDDLGSNIFRWTMEKISIGEQTLQQTIYACRYHSDAALLRVTWTPIEGEGNALVDGAWSITCRENGSTVTLKTSGMLNVDLPGFFQFLLSPMIVFAFTQKIDRYIANLKEALG
jgi:carbon monoxide dehydrogenase subunit G